MTEDLRDLYQDAIMKHGRRPEHGKRLEDFDVSAKGDNPMCGDRVEVTVKLDGAAISRIGFEARGCAISIASADLMAEVLPGRDKQGAMALFGAFGKLIDTGICPDCGPDLAEPLSRLTPLGSVHEYRSRLKCATLPWNALLSALNEARP
jgi:nitrogen fixation NifU-like protein